MVLIHHAVYAALLHGFAVMNVLRRELAVLLRQHFYQQQRHSYGDEPRAYEYGVEHFGCKGNQNLWNHGIMVVKTSLIFPK